MKAIVSEPQAEYKTTVWINRRVDNKRRFSAYDVEDGTRIVQRPVLRGSKRLFAQAQPPKIKLSSLIGKLSQKGADEMRQQIKDLRKEWERDI